MLLVNRTANSQRNAYQRWHKLVNRQRLIRECKMVSDFFAGLNYTIKSVADNALMDNKDR